jgi:hypothetical protein
MIAGADEPQIQSAASAERRDGLPLASGRSRGEILESYVTKARDIKAALRFMKKALKRHGPPEPIATDGTHLL